ncbi:MAG: hypothetical protein ABSE05_15430 [Syntrophales bacterium]
MLLQQMKLPADPDVLGLAVAGPENPDASHRFRRVGSRTGRS